MPKNKENKDIINKLKNHSKKLSEYENEFIYDFDSKSVREFAEKNGLNVGSLEQYATRLDWVTKKENKKKEIYDRAAKDIEKEYVKKAKKELSRSEYTIKAVKSIMLKAFNKMMDEEIPMTENTIFKAIEAWRKEAGEYDEKIAITTDVVPNLTDEQLKAIVASARSKRKRTDRS